MLSTQGERKGRYSEKRIGIDYLYPTRRPSKKLLPSGEAGSAYDREYVHPWCFSMRGIFLRS